MTKQLAKNRMDKILSILQQNPNKPLHVRTIAAKIVEEFGDSLAGNLYNPNVVSQYMRRIPNVKRIQDGVYVYNPQLKPMELLVEMLKRIETAGKNERQQ
jgi:hypothetical protein